MLRTWKPFVPALLLTLFAAVPARAQEFREQTLADKLDGIQRTLDATRSELNLKVDVQNATIRSLLERVEKLERDNAELKKQMQQMQANVRLMNAPPELGTGNSVFRLDNRTPYRATVVINDRTYTLAPFQSLDLPNQPAVAFTYEVWVDGFGLRQPRVVRTLNPRELYTISVNP